MRFWRRKRSRPPAVHELSVCQSLLGQVAALARAHGARRVSRIRLAVGPLSGVEMALLAQAFTLARAGTVAEGAVLETECLPVRVRCKVCGSESEAAPNRLLCAACGDWRTELAGGAEMLLQSVELELEDDHV